MVLATTIFGQASARVVLSHIKLCLVRHGFLQSALVGHGKVINGFSDLNRYFVFLLNYEMAEQDDFELLGLHFTFFLLDFTLNLLLGLLLLFL